MTYVRVIPRDLFNEANLLKCYGQLFLWLDGKPGVTIDHDGGPFHVVQNPSSGGTYIDNVRVMVRGSVVDFERPLNSREPYPLYATIDDTVFNVFGDNGLLDIDFARWITEGLDND